MQCPRGYTPNLLCNGGAPAVSRAPRGYLDAIPVSAHDGKATRRMGLNLRSKADVTEGVRESPRSIDLDDLSVLARKGARVGLADRPDQSQHLRSRALPIDQAIFGDTLCTIVRQAVVLLHPRRLAGCRQFNGLRHHLRQIEHMLAVETTRRLIRCDGKQTLQDDGAGIRALVDPEERRTRRLFVKQDGPGDNTPAPQTRERCRVKTDHAQPRDGAEGLAADLRPAEDQDKVGAARANGCKRVFGVHIGRMENRAARRARRRRQVCEIGMAMGSLRRERNHHGRQHPLRQQGIEREPGSFDGTNENETHLLSQMQSVSERIIETTGWEKALAGDLKVIKYETYQC